MPLLRQAGATQTLRTPHHVLAVSWNEVCAVQIPSEDTVAGRTVDAGSKNAYPSTLRCSFDTCSMASQRDLSKLSAAAWATSPIWRATYASTRCTQRLARPSSPGRTAMTRAPGGVATTRPTATLGQSSCGGRPRAATARAWTRRCSSLSPSAPGAYTMSHTAHVRCERSRCPASRCSCTQRRFDGGGALGAPGGCPAGLGRGCAACGFITTCSRDGLRGAGASSSPSLQDTDDDCLSQGDAGELADNVRAKARCRLRLYTAGAMGRGTRSSAFRCRRWLGFSVKGGWPRQLRAFN
jgi:hypothetical protein